MLLGLCRPIRRGRRQRQGGCRNHTVLLITIVSSDVTRHPAHFLRVEPATVSGVRSAGQQRGNSKIIYGTTPREPIRAQSGVWLLGPLAADRAGELPTSSSLADDKACPLVPRILLAPLAADSFDSFVWWCIDEASTRCLTIY